MLERIGTPLSTLQGNAATLKYRLTLPQCGLTAEYPFTNLHKNSVNCILTRSSENAAKFKQ